MSDQPTIAKLLVGETRVVALDLLHPNPWNPNKMDDRTYEAERESIRLYGFIDPVTVRPHPEIEGAYQIIDGEHRARAAGEEGYTEVTVTVLELDDDKAKKLTVILNETRGNADVVLLGKLLADLEKESDPAELLLGLPYSQGELEHFLALGAENWDRFREQEPEPPPPELETKLMVIEFPASVHGQVSNWLGIIQRELGLVSEAEAIVEATRERARQLNQGEGD